MEDGGRNRPETTDQVGSAPGDGEQAGAVPHAALLQLLTKDHTLPEELNGSTVSEYLMAVPIAHAVRWLDAHRRSCRRPNNCPDTPGPLRMLLKVHSVESLLEAADRIHSELWKHSQSRMLHDIRRGVLDSNVDLTEAVENGLLEDALRGSLRDQDESGIKRLAGVLWARGLTVDAERDLFRILPAFFARSDTEEPPPVEPPRVAPPVPEKAKHKKKRESAEARVKELEGEVTRLRTRGRDRAQELTAVGDELATARAELETARARIAELEDSCERSMARTKELEAERNELETRSRRASQANDQLRAELARANEESEQRERDRAHLTGELARARTALASAEAQLRAIPRAKDAVAAFLEAEEERIDQELDITQGADRIRAQEEHRQREKLEQAFRAAYPEYVPPRPETLGDVRTLRFTALGGGDEVGRSAYLVEVGTSRILVDCGLAVGRREIEEMVPDLERLGDVQAIVLTHAHTDHIGWLPALVAGIESPIPIYCTEATADITPIMLDDARGHYERLLARRQQIAAHDPTASAPVEHYTRDDLYEVETRLRALRFSDPADIPGTEIRLTFHPAGHILGAASVLLEGGGRRVLLSGDISTESQATIRAAMPPADLDPVDLLVLESTYGDRVRNAAEDERRALVEFVRRTTQHGTAILPCFALGRGQEVLKILLGARKAGDLDRSLTIWVDGLIRRINRVYADHLKLETAGYEEVTDPRARAFAIADCQRPDARAVVVTTSGMLTGGPVAEWAQALLRDPRHRMALLGYQDEGAPGGALRAIQRQNRPPYNVPLPREDGEDVTLRIASTVQEIGLSAHADRSGLLDYAAAIPARNIVLVHGDPRSQETLASHLSARDAHVAVHRPGTETLTLQ